MNRKQLDSELKARNVDAIAYDIFGSENHISDTYLLRYCQSGTFGKPNYWATYYSERGQEREFRKFDSEAEACEYFLEWITREGTA